MFDYPTASTTYSDAWDQRLDDNDSKVREVFMLEPSYKDLGDLVDALVAQGYEVHCAFRVASEIGVSKSGRLVLRITLDDPNTKFNAKEKSWLLIDTDPDGVVTVVGSAASPEGLISYLDSPCFPPASVGVVAEKDSTWKPLLVVLRRILAITLYLFSTLGVVTYTIALSVSIAVIYLLIT